MYTSTIAAILLSTFAVNAISADIAIKPWLIKGDAQKIERLSIDGEIKSGDALKLFLLAKENPRRFSSALQAGVVLNSNGGNVDEAIKISEVLKNAYTTTMAFAPNKCLSACFYIYAGSAVRYATPNTIGVHRPFLPRETMIGLSPEKAEKFTKEKYNEISKWLTKNEIPQDIIEKSFQRSSQEIYWLSEDDLSRIGNRSSWYEEWLIARCPEYPIAEKAFLRNPTGENRRLLEASAVCQHNIEREHRESFIAKMIQGKGKKE